MAHRILILLFIPFTLFSCRYYTLLFVLLFYPLTETASPFRERRGGVFRVYPVVIIISDYLTRGLLKDVVPFLMLRT